MRPPKGFFRSAIRALLADGGKTTSMLNTALQHRLPPEYVLRLYRHRRSLERGLRKPLYIRQAPSLEEEIWTATRWLLNDNLAKMAKEGMLAKHEGQWIILRNPKRYTYPPRKEVESDGA